MAENEPNVNDSPTTDTPRKSSDETTQTLRHNVSVKIPERIGRYHVKSVIASGGMGTVYEGHRVDGHFDQRVAVT